jgi:hypothetical protein
VLWWSIWKRTDPVSLIGVPACHRFVRDRC